MTKKIKGATDTIAELLGIYLVLVLVAATAFSMAEGKSMWDSIYWAGVTATSVGYGDISPVTVVGRITGLLLAHTSILIIVPLIVVRLVTSLVENHHEFTDDEQKYVLDTMAMIRQNLAPQQNNNQQNNQVPQMHSESAPHGEAYFRPRGSK